VTKATRLAGMPRYAAQEGLNFSIVDVRKSGHPFEVKASAIGPRARGRRGELRYVGGDKGLYWSTSVPDSERRAAGRVDRLAARRRRRRHDARRRGHRAGLEVYDLSAPDNPCGVGPRLGRALGTAVPSSHTGLRGATNTRQAFDPTLRVSTCEPRGACRVARDGGQDRGLVMGLDVVGQTCVVPRTATAAVFDVSGAVPFFKGVERSVLRLHSVTSWHDA